MQLSVPTTTRCGSTNYSEGYSLSTASSSYRQDNTTASPWNSSRRAHDSTIGLVAASRRVSLAVTIRQRRPAKLWSAS